MAKNGQMVESEEREEQTINSGDVAPLEEVLGQEAAVKEQLKKVVKTAIQVSMVFDWSPLGDESLIGHGLNLLGEIREAIPELVPVRSKGQNIALRFNSKTGKPCARLWFSKSKCAMNTLKINENGKGGHEPKDQSRYMPENGFPAKVRKTIIAEIRRYIKARNFKVPAPEAEA